MENKNLIKNSGHNLNKLSDPQIKRVWMEYLSQYELQQKMDIFTMDVFARISLLWERSHIQHV